MSFIGVEVEQDTSAPPPKKNPGSAPVMGGGGWYLLPFMTIWGGLAQKGTFFDFKNEKGKKFQQKICHFGL